MLSRGSGEAIEKRRSVAAAWKRHQHKDRKMGVVARGEVMTI